MVGGDFNCVQTWKMESFLYMNYFRKEKKKFYYILVKKIITCCYCVDFKLINSNTADNLNTHTYRSMNFFFDVTQSRFLNCWVKNFLATVEWRNFSSLTACVPHIVAKIPRNIFFLRELTCNSLRRPMTLVSSKLNFKIVSEWNAKIMRANSTRWYAV